MEKLDIETWSRKAIYQHYKSVAYPFYVVGFRIDVSNVYRYVKENQLSFYYTMIYLCTKAINSIENFHYIILDEEVYRIEDRAPSFTDLHQGTDAFYIVTCSLEDNLSAFCKKAKDQSLKQDFFLDYEVECENLIYFSCLPWIDTTVITNEHSEGESNDCTPRINWGKYVEENGKKILGMSIEVNHKVIDGYHVGLFVKKLEELIHDLI